MIIIIYTILAIICFIVFLNILWRFLSNRWSIPCPTWLSWLVEMDNPFFKISRAATIVQHLNLKNGMAVLDVGCGPGRVTIPLARVVGPMGNVVAMDIQEGMLKRVKEKAKSQHFANITYLYARLGEHKLEYNKFDRVIMVSVLGEIPNREDALNEVFNALKPNGILSITEIILDPHYQSRAAVRRYAESIGFKEKNAFGNFMAYTLHFEKLPE